MNKKIYQQPQATIVNICQGDNILAGSLLGVYSDTTTTQFSRRTDLWDDEDEEEDW